MDGDYWPTLAEDIIVQMKEEESKGKGGGTAGALAKLSNVRLSDLWS